MWLTSPLFPTNRLYLGRAILYFVTYFNFIIYLRQQCDWFPNVSVFFLKVVVTSLAPVLLVLCFPDCRLNCCGISKDHSCVSSLFYKLHLQCLELQLLMTVWNLLQIWLIRPSSRWRTAAATRLQRTKDCSCSPRWWSWSKGIGTPDSLFLL